jgi:hypothetical protein
LHRFTYNQNDHSDYNARTVFLQALGRQGRG